ncbi:rRNA maturation RNase YbeY [Sporosarcina sp. G11-34]|uniref:rRNA maturation RNase YbeY n=1 Tax=Sporosarcina sp. G11-34 TaxID=2849605 RepID=UPI0022A9DDD7|nr:rRNA maturation RNase YbeY [Sporosarcina sp. G11-34]MCZ2259357.1 rRNA maturation RNase YbeY [Sporosarcina sp. G11-34]
MLDLYFNDETNTVDENIQKLISEILTHAAKLEGVPEDAEVSVTFMTDLEIQKINAEYRGIDKSTDVISFALEEMTDDEVAIVAEEGMPNVLGDIIISVETAKQQAADYGHDFKREMGFLSLHGFLHLLGYDHMTEDDEAKMFGRQKEILDSFGLER